MSPDLSGSRVLVTGGSMGIGREVALVLATNGAKLVVAARTRSAIDDTLAELEGSGHEGLELDVSDDRAWRDALGGALSGELAGLVTAAGTIEPIGPIDSYDPEEFLATVRVNLYGTFLAIRHCLAPIRAAQGSIVTFSGGGATSPLPRFDAYAASKAAVVRLTENLAVQLRDDQVNVNAVAPGFIVTRMHEATLAAGEQAVGTEYFDRTKRETAEGGQPAREAAELVAFLLSDDAAQITGKLISAQWDPWREHEFRRRVANEPDLATLRRVDDMFIKTVER